MTLGVPQNEEQSVGDLPELAPIDPGDIGLADAQYLTLPDPRPSMLTSLVKLAKLSFAGIDRATQASRYTLLVGTGKMTFDGYKTLVNDAIHGKARLSGHDLGEIYLGKDTMKAMDRTPWIPGWVKTFVFPEHWLTGTDDPLVSVGDVASTTIDFLADPFLALSFTPANTAMGKALGWPFRSVGKFLGAFMGPRSGSPLSYVNILRNGEDVLTGPQREIWENIWKGHNKASQRLHGALTELSESDVGKWLAKNYRTESSQKVAVALHGFGLRGARVVEGGHVPLNQEETSAFNYLADLMERHGLSEARSRGLLPDSAQLSLFGDKAPLEDWLPKFVGRHFIPADIWQSWSPENLGRVHLRLRSGVSGAFGKRLGRGGRVTEMTAKLTDFDALEDTKDILYALARKLDLEPEMLRYSPYLDKSPAIANASRFQRRYVTDLLNVFQGNTRGRKQIEFDLMVGEAWEKLRATPVGARIERLFLKLGGGRTVDGVPDFSPTNKLAGFITHNILRSTLGLRLSTGLQNATQVTNFGISRGLPATFRGMLRFSDRQYRDLRAAENLLGDFQRIFSDDQWVGKLGKKMDDVIFAPMTLTENMIRGTGFNLGLDMALKKRGLKSLADVTDPKIIRTIANEAHLESLTGSFLYGPLGRSPLAANPVFRVATVLTTFPQKQAEFLYREFSRDGSAFLRFVGIHGWLIEQANKQFGVAGEDFLGWGFRPMTTSFSGVPIVMSPPGKALMSTSQALSAWATGDRDLAERKWKEAAFNMDGALGFVAHFASAGLLPLPVLAIQNTKDLVTRLKTHRQELPDGSYVDIASDEAVADYLSARTTTQRARSDLAKAETAAKRKIDYVLGKRTKAFVDAALGDKGDDLGQRAWDLVSGIEVEGALFYPTDQMLHGRINDYVEKKTVSKDLRAILHGGFLQQVYLGAQLELLDHLDRGLHPVHTPSGRGVSP